MAGIRMFEEQLQIMSPHTLNALQKLVMAMADLAKNAGKKTFFGRDKGQEAYKIHEDFHMEMVAKMLIDLNLEEDKALLGSLEILKEFFQSNYMNSSD